MKDWNEYIRIIREARDQRPRPEQSPLKSPYQQKAKARRDANDITVQSSKTAGHKNLGTGAPFDNKTQRAGTDRLRFEEDVDPASIDLDSFQIQDDLERRIWDDKDKLKPLLREYMLKIAMDFIESLDLKVNVRDIKLTGSIANYNWSKFSDVDLHIVVDMQEYGEDEELVRGYFDGKRIAWNENHDIKLSGYDVELYIEGASDIHIATGMYSVLTDGWIVKPEHESHTIEEDLVRQKAAYLMDLVDAAEMMLSREDYKAAHKMADKLKAKIRRMRSCGLEQGGAYSPENLAFKVLRRNGYLSTLSDVKNRAYDGMRTYDSSGSGIVVKI
tara:strand:+ start:18 stop:1007 length:990 start_codon:yes stop_codon:yes gene_type:complete